MDEKKEKAQESNSLDELMELCNKEGIEIPDELLDSVAGGISPEQMKNYPELMEKLREELRRRGLLEEENRNRPPLYPSL